jgi:hypothetical protein
MTAICVTTLRAIRKDGVGFAQIGNVLNCVTAHPTHGSRHEVVLFGGRLRRRAACGGAVYRPELRVVRCLRAWRRVMQRKISKGTEIIISHLSVKHR